MTDAQQHRACFIVGGAHHSCEEIVELEAAHESCSATIADLRAQLEREQDLVKAKRSAIARNFAEARQERDKAKEQAEQRLSECRETMREWLEITNQ